jgi:hypothetical protein
VSAREVGEQQQREGAALQVQQLGDRGPVQREPGRVEHLGEQREGGVDRRAVEPDAPGAEKPLRQREVIGERVPSVAGDEGVEGRERQQRGHPREERDGGPRGRPARELAQRDAQRGEPCERGDDHHADHRGRAEEPRHAEGRERCAQEGEARGDAEHHATEAASGGELPGDRRRRSDRGQVEDREGRERAQQLNHLLGPGHRRLGDHRPLPMAHAPRADDQHRDDQQGCAAQWHLKGCEGEEQLREKSRKPTLP